MIRDEPEQNLFLECLQSINQPATATEPPERRRSARHSQSTPSHSTPSPSTRAASPKEKEACQHNQQSTRAPSPKGKEECQHNQQSSGKNSPRKKGRFKIHTTLNKDGLNVNFQEWLGELAAGHTSHTKYKEWLTERIDDNRQLTREAEAEEQQRDKRLLARLVGWGRGLNRPTTSKVVMTKEKQTITPERSDAEVAPVPAPAEKQQKDPMTSIDEPLLSGLVPPDSPLLPGTSQSFRKSLMQREPNQTVRMRALERMQELIQPTAALHLKQTWRLITMAHRAKRAVQVRKINRCQRKTINHPVHSRRQPS